MHMAEFAEKATHQTSRGFPVIEIFGPTIQGEGSEAGLPTHFVRLGGCDFRCIWCDTMYAVDPEAVRANSVRMSTKEILGQVRALGGGAHWVTLSGGNPALHELGQLVSELQADGLLVAVETQGSVWRDWLGHVDRLTISPKPPSSEMATPSHAETLDRFMIAAMSTAADRAILKIVCFDEPDFRWAKAIAACWPDLPLFLSAGTPVPAPSDIRSAVGERYRWLCERTAADPDLGHARVLPQLHVIAWEGAKGV
jgi:7-carboxy-7-deazaguanine synthase